MSSSINASHEVQMRRSHRPNFKRFTTDHATPTRHRHAHHTPASAVSPCGSNSFPAMRSNPFSCLDRFVFKWLEFSNVTLGFGSRSSLLVALGCSQLGKHFPRRNAG